MFTSRARAPRVKKRKKSCTMVVIRRIVNVGRGEIERQRKTCQDSREGTQLNGYTC